MRTIRTLPLPIALCMIFVCGAATCFAEPERLLYSTRNISPATIAEKLGEVFKDAGVTIATVPPTNSVLISAPANTLREIERLLGQLDKRPRQISITAWIIDLKTEPLKEKEAATSAPFFSAGPRKEFVEQLAKLEKEGRVAVVNEFQFTTIENQPVSAQQGERKPRIVATNITTTGRINTTTFENVGTLMKFQARVIANNELELAATVEKSFIGPESKGLAIAEPNNGPAVKSPSYLTLVALATVNMKSGEVVNVTGLKSKPDDVAGDFQVLIGAEILPEPAEK